MNILITGGTGSLGQALAQYLASHSLLFHINKIIIFSRDEWKQSEMAKHFPYTPDLLQYFLGDVRDEHRLKQAFHKVDIVIHAAALKRVDAVAYNPTEVLQTNVMGTQRVLDAAIACKVKKVMVVSSDKACEPVNIYGKTKAIAEELAISYNSLGFPQGTASAVVRYGNVLTSRGSAYHTFKALGEQNKPIPITNPHMTRFAISMDQAVQFVWHAVERMYGGEMYIPRLPSIKITDLAKMVAPYSPQELVGKRLGGEKLHESMISRYEADRALFYKSSDWFIINPLMAPWGYHTHVGGESIGVDGHSEHTWTYDSLSNGEWISGVNITELLTTGTCSVLPRRWVTES